jgi:glycosyltransferase involved in cell wall biosynthesis
MKSPVVSVIIPTYNSVHFVTQAIASVLAQTFQDFEVLVIDDGSTDNTKEVLKKKYGDKIHYLFKTNGGVSSARNFGIEKAKGKYLAFLDADDIWLPEKLEKQISLLEAAPEIGLCYAGAIVVDEDLNPKNYVEAEQYEDATEGLLLKMNILILSSSFIRSEIVRQTGGFDSEFSTCADKEYWLRLSLLTKLAPVEDYLVKYRQVSGSMSSDPKLSKTDTLNVLRKFFGSADLPAKYKKLENKAFSNSLMVISGEFLHNGEWKDSIYCMWQALLYNPFNLKRPLGLPFRFLKRLLSN